MKHMGLIRRSLLIPFLLVSQESTLLHSFYPAVFFHLSRFSSFPESGAVLSTYSYNRVRLFRVE